MIVHAISDLHGYQPDVPGGDILIIAGDCTKRDRYENWLEFFEWVKRLPYDHVILVGGNHCGSLQNHMSELFPFIPDKCIYLKDNLSIIKGLKIYGYPWTPRFMNWHFMLSSNPMKNIVDRIPEDLDILVTHGPPRNILDDINGRGEKVGCVHLEDAVKIKKPKHHIFGHIHECAGRQIKNEHTTFYNVSCVDERCRLIRGITRIDIA